MLQSVVSVRCRETPGGEAPLAAPRVGTLIAGYRRHNDDVDTCFLAYELFATRRKLHHVAVTLNTGWDVTKGSQQRRQATITLSI